MTDWADEKALEIVSGIHPDPNRAWGFGVGKIIAQALRDAVVAEQERYTGVVRQLADEGYISSAEAAGIIGAATHD